MIINILSSLPSRLEQIRKVKTKALGYSIEVLASLKKVVDQQRREIRDSRALVTIILTFRLITRAA